MVYHTEKIISIGGKRYSAVELLPELGTDTSYLVVREMILNKKEYRHPVSDELTVKMVYNLMPKGNKAVISLELWDDLEDENKEGYKIDHSLGY